MRHSCNTGLDTAATQPAPTAVSLEGLEPHVSITQPSPSTPPYYSCDADEQKDDHAAVSNSCVESDTEDNNGSQSPLLTRDNSTSNIKVSRAVSLDATISKKLTSNADNKRKARPKSLSGSSLRYSSKDGSSSDSRSSDAIQRGNSKGSPVFSEPEQNSASSKEALLDAEGTMGLECTDCLEGQSASISVERETDDVDSGCSECESVGSNVSAASDNGDNRVKWHRKSKVVRTNRFVESPVEGDSKVETNRSKSSPQEQKGNSGFLEFPRCTNSRLFFLYSQFACQQINQSLPGSKLARKLHPSHHLVQVVILMLQKLVIIPVQWPWIGCSNTLIVSQKNHAVDQVMNVLVG